MQQSMGSTDFLRLMVEKDLHVVLVRRDKKLKLGRDKAILKFADGNDVSIEIGHRFVSERLELPEGALDDYLAASLVRADGVDESGNELFVLTADGRERGKPES